MKRTALALAAAVLGTGCVVVDDNNDCTATLTLQWDFMDDDGVVRGCTAAARTAIQSVDIWVDGSYVATFPCFDGIGTIGIGRGQRFVTVEGISSGTIAYRQMFTSAGSCGDQLVSVTPAQGTATLDFAETAGCPIGTSCYLWFSLTDDVTGEVVAGAGANGNQTTYPYVDGAPWFVLPEGPYTLDWMQLVSQSFTERARTCAAVPFDVVGGQDSFPSVPLRTTGVACTP